jgi:hypothetical protein
LGGVIDLFSANGDLNAGKGPKSKAAYPPLKLITGTIFNQRESVALDAGARHALTSQVGRPDL